MSARMISGGSAAVGSLPLVEEVKERRRPGLFRLTLRLAARKPMGAFGALIIMAMVVMAIAAPLVARYDPAQSFQRRNPNYDPSSTNLLSNDRDQFILDAKGEPSMKHWLGTDDAGRDIWSRIVWGTRRSLGIGISALLVALGAGSALGIASAYFGGKLDTFLQRFLDGLQAFPALLILILVASAFELSLRNFILALGFVGITQVSRIVRGTVLALREMPFVEAGRVLGASDLRLMVRHILPNTLAPIIVVFTIGLGSVIIAEASLSFLALAPPGVSWGEMLNSGRNFIYTSPWQAVFSGLAITLAVLAFNLLGDALRDILDPRLRV
jgi:peptide/nickel transport system permease protein